VSNPNSVAIFGTNLSLKPDVVIEDIRAQLARLRGQLDDVKHRHGWDDRLNTACEGLTLVISYLYGVIKEIQGVK
jgi:hypothetical protein